MGLEMSRLRWRAVPVLIVVLGLSALAPALAEAASRSSVGAHRASAARAVRHGWRKAPRRHRRITLHKLPRCPAVAYNYPTLPPPGPGFVAEARREARAVIGKVRFPSGTKPVAHSRARSPSDVCAQDPETAGYYDYWVSDRDLQSLRDWVKVHPPAGAFLVGGGGVDRNGVLTSWYWSFQYLPASLVTDGAQLSVSGKRLSEGRTAIRVDADVSWLVLRPASERVPPEVSTITMKFDQFSAPQGHTTQTVTVTDPTQVDEVGWLTDVLPVEQPVAVAPPCGPEPMGVDVKFEDTNGITVAEANDEVCGGIAFSIHGHMRDPLAAGDYYNVLHTAFDSTNG
jgi:hypothetical protein